MNNAREGYGSVSSLLRTVVLFYCFVLKSLKGNRLRIILTQAVTQGCLLEERISFFYRQNVQSARAKRVQVA